LVAIKWFYHGKHHPSWHHAVVEYKLSQHLFSLDQRHSVEMFDIFLHHGHVCIVMELGGRSLNQISRPTDPIRIIHEVLLALEVMHKEGIVHADVMARNILVQDNTVKLIDFGSAVGAGRFHNESSGARCYFAPEILVGRPFGLEVDAWGVGCLWWLLLTGDVSPFHDSSIDDLARAEAFVGPFPSWMYTAAGMDGSARCIRPGYDAALRIIDHPAEVRDAVLGLLRPDPGERLTIEEALGVTQALIAKADADVLA
jgi:serine/threonine protein kinase